MATLAREEPTSISHAPLGKKDGLAARVERGHEEPHQPLLVDHAGEHLDPCPGHVPEDFISRLGTGQGSGGREGQGKEKEESAKLSMVYMPHLSARTIIIIIIIDRHPAHATRVHAGATSSWPRTTCFTKAPAVVEAPKKGSSKARERASSGGESTARIIAGGSMDDECCT